VSWRSDVWLEDNRRFVGCDGLFAAYAWVLPSLAVFGRSGAGGGDSGVSRQVIRDWAGHGSDKLIDLYTKKMWEYHSPEMAKVKPLLDSNWTQTAGEESGTSPQVVVN
jgi:hypothetical protein